MNSIFIGEATPLRRRLDFSNKSEKIEKSLFNLDNLLWRWGSQILHDARARWLWDCVPLFAVSVDLSRMHTHDFHFAIRMAKEKNETESKSGFHAEHWQRPCGKLSSVLQSLFAVLSTRSPQRTQSRCYITIIMYCIQEIYMREMNRRTASECTVFSLCRTFEVEDTSRRRIKKCQWIDLKQVSVLSLRSSDGF